LFSWDGNGYREVFKIKEEHSKTIRCLEFSPDGKYLASGGFDSLIVIWELNRENDSISLEPTT